MLFQERMDMLGKESILAVLVSMWIEKSVTRDH